MDFSNYPRLPSTTSNARDVWPTVSRAGDRFASAAPNPWPLDYHRTAGSHGNFFSATELPPHECFSGVAADSSCALSLLSTQPWGNHTTSNRTPVMPHSHAPQSVGPGNFTNSSWGYRGRVERPGSHEMPNEMGIGILPGAAGAGNDQFTGELELDLQGNGPNPDHGSSRGFDHSGHGMHWSL